MAGVDSGAHAEISAQGFVCNELPSPDSGAADRMFDQPPNATLRPSGLLREWESTS
jgi:hypothetical protein